MRARNYCAHPNTRDHWTLRCMNRCPDLVVCLKRDLQCLRPQASLVLIYRPNVAGMKGRVGLALPVNRTQDLWCGSMIHYHSTLFVQCPKQLLSDRNAAFTSSKFKKFLKHLNIRQLLTSANRPQCNGKNERVNQTLVAKLRCKVNSTTKTPWTKLLEQVTYEYNNSPHDVTDFPPAYLMFGTLPYDSPLPNQVKLNYPPIQQARQIAVN
ncbi:retrotransposable element Tf2 protein type 1 [Trichonephila clavipes]|nr:retrotransposable element Tf2 protein type 1 [Trichonephila clavipes]